MTFLYVAAIPIGLVIGWFVLGLILSLVLPRSYTGKKYMQRKMKANGYHTEDMPELFWNDCTDFAEKTLVLHKMASKSKVELNAEFTRTLDMLANLVAQWEQDPNDSIFVKEFGQESPYKKIFEKYQFIRVR